MAVAAAKFFAAAVGGSAAMLSEGIHSAIDAANDSLLLVGLRKSRQQPDAQHPFGCGKELYFWSLVVAFTIFAVGGGVTLFEGVRRLSQPHPVGRTAPAYIALACGFAFDGVSLIVGLRQFRRENPGKRFWEAVKEAKDPSTFTVVGEDSLALIGVMIAALGLRLNSAGIYAADGLASILIGILLGCMAAFLIWETHHLVIGEAVEEEVTHAIHEIADDEEAVMHIGNPRTMHFGPDEVLLTMSVRFDRSRSASEIFDALDRIEDTIRRRFPAIRRIYIEPEPADQRRG